MGKGYDHLGVGFSPSSYKKYWGEVCLEVCLYGLEKSPPNVSYSHKGFNIVHQQ